MGIETIRGKEVIDVAPAMFFTVTLATKKRPTHVLVKAESAIAALDYAQKAINAPAVGAHITEYERYLDTSEELVLPEESTSNIISDVKEVTEQNIKEEKT